MTVEAIDQTPPKVADRIGLPETRRQIHGEESRVNEKRINLNV